MASVSVEDRPVVGGRPRADAKVCARLLECLHQDPSRAARARLAIADAGEWEALFALARSHQVDALLAFRLEPRADGGDLPEAARQAARAARREGVHSALLVRETLARLTKALHTAGVSVIVLKGGYLAHVVYPDPSLRWMSDVDLLVRPADLQRAAAVLRANGCSQADAEDVGAETSTHGHHLPGFVQAYPPKVELHWRLSADDVPPQDEMWARAVPARMARVDALGLCPEDLLLHLCMHGSYTHRFDVGLRPICDVAETIRHFGKTIAWADVEDRARRYGRHRGLYLMLRLAKEMLGAAVPDEVLRAGPSGSLDHALRTARFLSLEGNRIGRGLPSRVVSVASATTWSGRIRTLWRSLFVPPDVLAASFDLSPRSPRLLLYYPLRLKTLLRRHGAVVLQVLRRDPAITPLARDVAMVELWLSEDAPP